jgi:Uma2 family endonuclease
MTSDEFIAWAMEQPEGCHYELVDGEVVPRPAQCVAHARTKVRVWRRMAEAVEAGAPGCEFFPSGLAVEVDENTVYEPDALIRCGAPLSAEAIKVNDPVVVVEVVSPWCGGRDAGAKLEDYFRLPTVRHYLIVKTENHAIIHHARGPDGCIYTRVVRDAPIVLDPPGITLTDCFPPGID